MSPEVPELGVMSHNGEKVSVHQICDVVSVSTPYHAQRYYPALTRTVPSPSDQFERSAQVYMMR